MPPDDPVAFDEAHRQLVSDSSIQFDMPVFVPPEIPSWVKWLIEFLTSPFAKYFLWAMLGAGLLLIIYLMARQLHRIGWLRAKGEAAGEPEEIWQPEQSAARALLQEADLLADGGRYDEAAHLLLFRSIEDIDARRPRLVRPALTSRDIADAPQLPPGPREAFLLIVAMVEKSLFGGRRLAETDWRACRSAYEQFAFVEAWN
jgi:hypothetical protein